MVDYKKYINLLKNIKSCYGCIFLKYKNSKIFNHYYYKYKEFTPCLLSIACFCETELKMTEEQIIKYIFKDISFCKGNLVISRIIDFIEKNYFYKKLQIE